MILSEKPASPRFIVGALLIALVAQIALYWPTLHQLPFGDDWGPPLTEVVRGQLAGPLSFFTETRQVRDYRPMQSLLIWLFGRVDEAHRWESIRILHFLSSAVAFVVLGLLVRLWRFGKPGVIAAAAVLALHPALVAPVGSIDGFSSILSDAAVWWGVWMMWLARDKPFVGIALACVAMIVGTLVKEYAFAMGPTAVLVAFMIYKPRWRSAIVAAVVLGALTIFLLWVRRFIKPTDLALPASDFHVDSITKMAGNAALVIVGGFFFGDSLWVYVTRDAAAIGVALVTVAFTAVYFGGGIWNQLFAARSVGKFEENREHVPEARATLIAFLILSFATVTFPANIVMRISEMYLCGMVFAVAFLAALAADGWARSAGWQRRTAAIIGVALAISAAISDELKILPMIELGKRSRVQTDAILEAAKGLPDGSKIALLYRADQVPERYTFSSFRLPDYLSVRPPAADYLFPPRKITLLCPEDPTQTPIAPVRLLKDEAAVLAWDRSQADVVLYWDVDVERFTRLK